MIGKYSGLIPEGFEPKSLELGAALDRDAICQYFSPHGSGLIGYVQVWIDLLIRKADRSDESGPLGEGRLGLAVFVLAVGRRSVFFVEVATVDSVG